MSGFPAGAEYSAGREAGVQEDLLHEDRSAASPAADRANPAGTEEEEVAPLGQRHDETALDHTGHPGGCGGDHGDEAQV